MKQLCESRRRLVKMHYCEYLILGFFLDTSYLEVTQVVFCLGGLQQRRILGHVSVHIHGYKESVCSVFRIVS